MKDVTTLSQWVEKRLEQGHEDVLLTYDELTPEQMYLTVYTYNSAVPKYLPLGSGAEVVYADQYGDRTTITSQPLVRNHDDEIIFGGLCVRGRRSLAVYPGAYNVIFVRSGV